MEDYTGTKFKIIHCDDANKSLNEALKRVPQHTKRVQQAKFERLIARLGDGKRMPDATFPTEAELPDKSKFKAIKKLPLRAYLWLSKKYRNTYFISHYIYKDKQKLSPKDTAIVIKNWRIKEEE